MGKDKAATKRSSTIPYLNYESQIYKDVRDQSLTMMETNKEYGNIRSADRLKIFTLAMEKVGAATHITGITPQKLEKKFKSYVCHRMPTGDPNCPEHIRRAKRIWRDIQNEAVNLDVINNGSSSGIQNMLAAPPTTKPPRRKNFQDNVMQMLQQYMLECPPHKFQCVPGTQKVFCAKCGDTKQL